MKIYIDNEMIIELSDIDKICLDNDLLSKKEWIKAAIIGKVNACKKRMIRDWQSRIFEDPAIENIPANCDDFIKMVIARNDYKNRIERDAEELKQILLTKY